MVLFFKLMVCKKNVNGVASVVATKLKLKSLKKLFGLFYNLRLFVEMLEILE